MAMMLSLALVVRVTPRIRRLVLVFPTFSSILLSAKSSILTRVITAPFPSFHFQPASRSYSALASAAAATSVLACAPRAQSVLSSAYTPTSVFGYDCFTNLIQMFMSTNSRRTKAGQPWSSPRFVLIGPATAPPICMNILRWR